MLFFIIDIIALIGWLNYKGKVEVLEVQENVNEQLLELYKKKAENYKTWFYWCLIIDVAFFLFF